MKKERLVCIGNGMSCMRTVEELLNINSDLYEITIFGAEPHVNYNRIQLSPLLAGENEFSDIILHDQEWYQKHHIKLYSGERIVAIKRNLKQVVSESGLYISYDKLLLATGSTPFTLPIPGKELDGVTTFRNVADVQNMLAACHEGKAKAVVIGGGLLGLEAANGLLKQGMEVVVVHRAENLMNRQLDKSAAELLQYSLQQRGLEFMLTAETESILGSDKVTGVRFTDGEEISADLVVMAAGILPDTELAMQAGLHCEHGIVVNDTMQTYDPGIYAVGECVQHRQQTYGLVAPLYEQAKVCANHLAGLGYSIYPGSTTATSLKVSGIDLFSAGRFQETDSDETIVFQDSATAIYKKLVIDNDSLQGVVLYGDISDSAWYLKLIKDAADIRPLRQQLMFGNIN